MNIATEINGTHLVADVIAVANANAGVQCERVLKHRDPKHP